MPASRWLARAAAAGLALAAAEPRSLRVLPNGAPLGLEALAVEADGWQSLRQQVEAHFGPSLWHDPSQEWQLTDENGTNVSSWEDVTALPGSSPLLGAVPSGKLFQWGPRAVGERFPVRVSDRQGVEMETVALSPRIFLIHNLLSQEEAIHLIERAGERTGENALTTSGVGFKTAGPRSTQSLRTSSSAFDSESEVSKRVLRRAFEVTRVPYQESLADGLQILRYQEGQAYIAHRDWFPAGTGSDGQNFDTAVPGGSNRFATVFLYLWSPPSGGYTVFPQATLDEGVKDTPFISTGRDSSALEQALSRAHNFYNKSAWELKLTQQCYSKLAVKPVQLGAALFYHQDPMTGRLLEEAEHGACPSLTGTKWGANLWIWNTARHLTRGKAAEPVSVQFVNDEARALDLAWSTDDGAKWVHFVTLPTGQGTTATTFGGHWWHFAEPGTTQEVRRWVVPKEARTVRFSSSGVETLLPLNGQKDADSAEL